MSGSEADMQARRRTLLVLEDETRRVIDAARLLGTEFEAVAKGDKNSAATSMEKIKKAEEDVITLRRVLVRELAQIGTLLVNREDLLRTSFAVQDIVGQINGIAFKISQLRRSLLRVKKQREALSSLLDLLIEEVSKLNECVRAVSINTEQSFEMAAQIQKMEGQIDSKYRETVAMVMKSVGGYRDLIATKDTIQAIEDCADAILLAADSTTIVALGV